MPVKHPSDSSFEQLFRNYQRRATEAGRKFALTRNQFRLLTRMPCHYCGAPPTQRYRRTGGLAPYIYNGLDRIDNTRGYTGPNTVACCGRCNEWKKALPVETFLQHVAQIASNLLRTFRRE